MCVWRELAASALAQFRGPVIIPATSITLSSNTSSHILHSQSGCMTLGHNSPSEPQHRSHYLGPGSRCHFHS